MKSFLLRCRRRRSVFDVDDSICDESEPLVIALDQGLLDANDDVVLGLPLQAVQDVERFQDGFKLK